MRATVRLIIILTIPFSIVYGLLWGMLVGLISWWDEIELAWKFPADTRIAKLWWS